MIQFSNISKRFGSVQAVSKTSLEIASGECFGLLGPNGAGKTTLIRLLLGFSRPDSGSVSIGGVPSDDPRSRVGLAFLPEKMTAPPYLSAIEFVSRSLTLAGIDRGSESKVQEGLAAVGLEGNGTKKVRSFSKGMLQRLGLAAALVIQPRVLILDEPTSGLDPVGIREIRILLEKLKAQGTTIFLNSHILSEVEKICDTVGIMKEGVVLVKDAMRSVVRENETLEDVFLRIIGVTR